MFSFIVSYIKVKCNVVHQQQTEASQMSPGVRTPVPGVSSSDMRQVTGDTASGQQGEDDQVWLDSGVHDTASLSDTGNLPSSSLYLVCSRTMLFIKIYFTLFFLALFSLLSHVS